MLQCLLIDGSLTIQKVIKLALSNYDVNVSSLNSLHEASVFISSSGSKIDFIISDSFLEGTVNPQSLKKLSIQAHAPILILNGSYQGVDEASFKQEGFFFFLKKPFETASLISNIESLIKKPLPLKEGVSTNTNSNTIPNNAPSFIPRPPVPDNKPEINIPPTISFKEELSLQEKKESMNFSSPQASFNDEDSTQKIKLPPPPSLENLKANEFSSKDIVKEESTTQSTNDISIPPNPFSSKPSNLPPPPFIPNIPVGKNKLSKNDSQLDDINLPPPPFIKKEVPISNSTESTGDVFSKNLPPIPNIDVKKETITPNIDTNSTEDKTEQNVPFTPSKKYLEENIEKIVKEYINNNLEELVKQEVKNYCDTHFKNIATECIKEKINKLLEEKVSLSENS